MKGRKRLIILIIIMIGISGMYCQTTGDYRTVISGNWNNNACWQTYNGTLWTGAINPPDYSTANVITVSHEITLTANVRIDQTIIESTGKLIIPADKTLEVNNGVNEDIKLYGSIDWYGELYLSGSLLYVYPEGVINILGTNNKIFRQGAGYLSNYGTINWIGSGILIGGSKTINNYSSGVIDFRSDSGFYYDYGGDGLFTVNNEGLIKKSDGSGNTNFDHAVLNNSGTVEVQAGTIELGYGGSNSGTMNINSGKTLLFRSGTFTLNEGGLFDGSGTVRLTGGNLSADGTTNGTVYNTNVAFDMTGGELSGEGKSTIKGTMNWSGGTISIQNLNINSGATMNIEGASTKIIRYGNGNINNSGTVNWWGDGDIKGASMTINNYSGAVFDCHNDATIYYDGGGGSTFLFNNEGTLKKSAGTGTSDFDNVITHNSGTILVESGTLEFSAGGSNSGTVTVNIGKNMLLNGGIFTLAENGTFNGNGTFSFSGGTLSTTGATNGTIFDNSLTFNMSDGVINSSGKLTVKGTMNWSGGTISNGTLNINPGASLNISGSSEKVFRLSGGSLNNNGLITWTGTGGIKGGANTLNNLSGGVFDCQNNASIYYDGGGGPSITFNNQGILKKSAGTGTSTFNSINFNNYGTIKVETGTVDATLSNYSGNTLTGGTYNIAGTLRINNAAITTNNAEIILDGASSQLLNQANADALTNLSTNGISGTLILKNGRNFTTGAVNFTNNGTLDIGNGAYYGSVNVLVNDNSILYVRSSNGLTTNANDCEFQNTGTRTFSQNASYYYYGDESQQTGNALPTQVNTLAVNCPNGLSLTSGLTISNQLKLEQGVLNCNSNNLTIGTSESQAGEINYTSGWINGNVKRWLPIYHTGNILFPIGNASYYRGLSMNFMSTLINGGTLTARFNASDPWDTGFPLNDDGYTLSHISPMGYWMITPGDDLPAGTYNISVTAGGITG